VMLRNARHRITILHLVLILLSFNATLEAKHFYGWDNNLYERDADNIALPYQYSHPFSDDYADWNNAQEELTPHRLHETDNAEVSETDEPAGADQQGMMGTFEKFKRQAEKVPVKGDEFGGLTEANPSYFGLNGGMSWQTAVVIAMLCVGAAVIGIVLSVVYWPRALPNDSLDAEKQKTEKGGFWTGDDESTDRSLAQSAQMYHYQQQKQQMLAMGQETSKIHSPESGPDSGDDCDEPAENVYECPGLATSGELEVKNPLFQDDLDNEAETSTSTLKN